MNTSARRDAYRQFFEFTNSRVGVTILSFVLIAVIAAIDYVTGRDVKISSFYFIPVCWTTWKVGRNAGMVMVVVSSMAWVACDIESGYKYAHFGIPIWNLLTRLAVYFFVVYLLSAFHRAQHRLEEMVEQRTIALRHEIEERKKAENAKIQAERLAVVGGMAAQVAHEVRNPLGAITLTLDLVQRELGKISNATEHPVDEFMELMSDLREEVGRIDSVIQDYLLLARLRPAKLESLELNDLLQRKFALMKGVFSKAGVELKMNAGPSPMMVVADGALLWQAVLNLTLNGLEAMPNGGTLTVEIAREGKSILLRITDTGCGMTPAQTDKLFVPFLTSKAGGTGLGLSLVRQIITEHKGSINYQTSPGEGTTFNLIFPLDSEPCPEEVSSPAIHLT